MKKAIILFLAIILAACGFSGCAEKKVAVNDYFMIADFESREEVILNEFNGFFGKFDFCEDAKYVKNGKKSLKLTPLGDPNMTNEGPVMSISPLISGDKNNNFTNVERIQFDAFNACNEDVTIFMYLYFDGGANTSLKSREKIITLKPNVWQKCIYDFDASNSSLIYDITQVRSINFRFNQAKNGVEPVIYMDKLVAKTSKRAFIEPEIILDENELCSFDKGYQEFVVFSHGYGAVSGVTSTCSINNDETYSISGKSLKVSMPKGFTTEGSWPLIELSPKLVKKANFSARGSNTTLAFDVYNDNDKMMVFFIEFWAKKDGKIIKKIIARAAAPHKWTAMSTPYSEINAVEKITENLDFFRISWAEFNDKDTQTFYFDSFRFI